MAFDSQVSDRCPFDYLFSGGTVDCVVEQVEENGHLTDIHCPDGGPWGGTLVDTAFKHFLDEVFGETSVENFSNKYKSDELFIYSNFEIKKRNITTTSSERIRLRIPSRLAECSGGNAGVQHRIKQSKYQNDVEVLADKLIVDSKIFVHMFSESKRKLIEFIHSLFKEDEISGIDLIILVGGFACSPLIVDAVKNSFSDKHVIVPNDANLAVLKGAVLYGRLSLNSISQTDSVSAIISARHMRYTYGISTAVPFDDQKHSQAHKIEYEGRIPECENVFHVFFKAGQRVVPGKASETCVFNLTRLSNEIEVYRTRSKDPKYINDEGKADFNNACFLPVSLPSLFSCDLKNCIA